MSSYQIALVFGAIITALIASRLPRSRRWILAGALSFIGGTAYHRYGLPHYPMANLMLDASLCLMVYFQGREKWEYYLYRVFQASTLVSLVFIAVKFSAPISASHYTYVFLLEACNWIALILISSAAIQDRVKADGGVFYRSGIRNFHNSRYSLRQTRPAQPFHKVGR